jgi:hypothetical protein
VSFSGSVKKANTVSGLASICRSWTMGSVRASAVTLASPLFSLRLAHEDVEAIAPELVKEGAQLRQAFGARAVQAPGALAALGHEPGLLEHADVLRDGRARDVEVRRDLPGGELAVADEGQDVAAARLGEGVEGGLHSVYFSNDLR